MEVVKLLNCYIVKLQEKTKKRFIDSAINRFNDGFTLIAAGRLATMSQWRSSVIKMKHGFTLIELLVVIAIIGLTTSFVTAGFVAFDRSQKLKGAASLLKSDVRQVQNNALSGNKGINDGNISNYCPSDSTHRFGGWFIYLNVNSVNYSLNGICLTVDSGGLVTGQAVFGAKTVYLPGDIKIQAINRGVSSVNVVFRALSSDVAVELGSMTTFFDTNGNIAEVGSGDLIITLANSNNDTANVVVKPSGETN